MKVLTTEDEHKKYIKKYYQTNYFSFLIMCFMMKCGLDFVCEPFFQKYDSFNNSDSIVKLLVASMMWALFFSVFMHLFMKQNTKKMYPRECSENYEGYDYYLSCSYGGFTFAKPGFLFIGENKISFVRKKKNQIEVFLQVEDIKASDISVVKDKRHILTKFLLGNSIDYLQIKQNNQSHKFWIHEPERVKSIILENK